MRIPPSLGLCASVFGRLAWSQDSTAQLTTHLRFKTAVSRSPIPVGDTATLLFRLRNVGPTPITLRFGTTCQILPNVARKETGEIAYPTGGLPVCGAAVTYLTIPALGERLTPLQVRARTDTDALQRQVLAPGDYVAYATLAGPYTLKPDTLAFSVQPDTARPPVPLKPNLPDDSTLTVPSPSGMNVRYYRNILVIVFHNSTSGVTVRRILAKYRGVIIGGSEARDDPGYYVRIPDPGTTFAAVDSVASLIETEPGVKLVYIPTWRGLIRIR